MENLRAIQVQGLHKRFGEIQAVQGVHFDVAQGQIFGLLGPSGASKSTTICMLSCLLPWKESHGSVDRQNCR